MPHESPMRSDLAIEVESTPPTCVVLLGASNLTWAFPHVMTELQSGLPGPVQVFAALGHGRSFGLWSRVVFRELPGIVNCRLWDDVGRHSAASARTLALVTDVGNDLIYGASVGQIVVWVECCLKRLQAGGAEIVLTLLPMASLERLSAIRYHLTRLAFFPGRNIGWPEMFGRALELNRRIEEVGRRFDARVVNPPGEWYGFDPIHIRRSRRRAAWRTILSQWSAFDGRTPSTRIGGVLHARLWLHSPAERRIFGRLRTTEQPVAHIPNVVMHLY